MKIRLSAAVALTVVSLGLTACGGDDEPDQETSSSASESESASASPSEPATEAEPETEAETDEGGADMGDKPAREEVIAGYEAIITSQTTMELPEDIVTKAATCFVDELYDGASAQTLQAIADERPEGIDPADASMFTEAATTCTAAG